jgi:hypothetical protein
MSKPELVVQPTLMPTRKLSAALGSLVLLKALFAVGSAAFGWGWMTIPEVTTATEVLVPLVAGYVTKDRKNT